MPSVIERMLESVAHHYHQTRRRYVGMSGIGHDCALKVYFDFHWAGEQYPPVETILKFEDGHSSEYITLGRLNNTDGILMIAEGSDGQQFGFKDFGGHFAGHVDGYIYGTERWPTISAVWEHKCTNEKNFRLLNRIIEKDGMDNALHKWSSVYYVQAQLYMHYSEVPRHYTTVCTAGSREYTEIYTEYCREYALAFVDHAKILIEHKIAPQGINSKPVYPCTTCDHIKTCHKGELPQVNCRTCIYAKAITNGSISSTWLCRLDDTELCPVKMLTGCDQHLYEPQMIKHQATQIDCEGDSITYEWRDTGEHFINEALVDGRTSLDLFESRRVKA